MKMRGVTYTKSAEKGMGVMAKVEKVIPEVVHDGEYKYLLPMEIWLVF